MNVRAEQLREQITLVLTAWGMDPQAVRISAEIMTDTDLAGVDSHGVGVLKLYEELRSWGRLNAQAKPTIVREGPTTALIDADSGLGHSVGVMAMELAISKAKANGLGAVSVFNSQHFGAAGYYATLATRQGLIGVVTSTTRIVSVVPTRSAAPVFGTNPIAFAAPAARNPPFLLDMSTSTVAINKIKAYSLRNKPLPRGWVMDGKGQPVTDAALAADNLFNRKVGGVTPIGGTPEMSSHKGYGLAMMVQILAGTLGGGSFSPIRNRTQGKSDPDNIGHFFFAMNPGAFRPDGQFENDLDATIDVLRQCPAASPDEPVLVPGDPEKTSREVRSRDGIPIPDALAAEVRGICERSGVPFILGKAER